MKDPLTNRRAHFSRHDLSLIRSMNVRVHCFLLVITAEYAKKNSYSSDNDNFFRFLLSGVTSANLILVSLSLNALFSVIDNSGPNYKLVSPNHKSFELFIFTVNKFVVLFETHLKELHELIKITDKSFITYESYGYDFQENLFRAAGVNDEQQLNIGLEYYLKDDAELQRSYKKREEALLAFQNLQDEVQAHKEKLNMCFLLIDSLMLLLSKCVIVLYDLPNYLFLEPLYQCREYTFNRPVENCHNVLLLISTLPWDILLKLSHLQREINGFSTIAVLASVSSLVSEFVHEFSSMNLFADSCRALLKLSSWNSHKMVSINREEYSNLAYRIDTAVICAAAKGFSNESLASMLRPLYSVSRDDTESSWTMILRYALSYFSSFTDLDAAKEVERNAAVDSILRNQNVKEVDNFYSSTEIEILKQFSVGIHAFDKELLNDKCAICSRFFLR